MNLFEPDTLLPAQFFAAFTREGGMVRERRLMLAVLQDAVECYQKYALARDPRGRLLFDDAAEWIDADEREWSFSYVNICEVLGLNPGYLRRGLLRWRQSRAPIKRNTARIVSLLEREALLTQFDEAEPVAAELQEAS
mgnify:CR=1 FL=1|jgi:hypothetical protein